MTAGSVEDSGESEDPERVEAEGVGVAGEVAVLPGAVATVWSDIVMAAHRRLREGARA